MLCHTARYEMRCDAMRCDVIYCMFASQVMQGYYKNPQATAATIRPDGFMHTGDIGFFDDRGWLEITDRIKELIKYKGFQVAPAELEALINSMPGVADVVVIPVLDEEAGEIPRAYVVRGAGSTVTEGEILELIKGHLAPHKQLRGGVRFVEAVPRAVSGKLLRRKQIELDRATNN
jgi:acyl-CoA synthetase (AMP-forming)/AMP-acid ligase II